MKDLSQYARQTNARLIIGGFIVIVLVGEVLIFLDYGLKAAGLGLICMLAGLSPVILIILILLAIEWLIKRIDRN